MTFADLQAAATPTLGGLCGLFVLLVFTGRLVPWSSVKRELEASEQRTEDWRKVATMERETRELQGRKDDEILALLREINTTLIERRS